MTPPEELRAAADRALREDPVGALAYGAGSGYAPLREWIAERNGVEPERVFVANGSLEAGHAAVRHAGASRATPWSSRRRRTTARCSGCSAAAQS